MTGVRTRVRELAVLAVLLLVSGGVMLNANEPAIRGARAFALDITGSVEKRFAWFGRIWSSYRENEQLQAQVLDLNDQVARMRQAGAENERLRDVLGLAADSLPDVLAARIVVRDQYGVDNLFTLDVGRRDGVEPGMAVVAGQGILGRIVTVSANYSRVMPYLNTAFRVPAVIEPLSAVGMVSWPGQDPEALMLEDVVKTVPVEVGQLVVTHEASGVFPPHWTIGVIESRQHRQGENSWDIWLRPAAPLHSTHHAFVLMRHSDPERLELEALPIE